MAVVITIQHTDMEHVERCHSTSTANVHEPIRAVVLEFTEVARLAGVADEHVVRLAIRHRVLLLERVKIEGLSRSK